MSELILQYEAMIYSGCYFASIALIASWEAFRPRRALTQPMGLRWSSNILLTVIDIAVVRAVFPFLGVLMAVHAAEQGWGIGNLIELPFAVSFVLAFLILDLSNYVQHFVLHRVPLLWKLHVVHHSDRDYDFSTGLRFHPFEALFTSGAEILTILALGPPAIAVVFYKVLHVFMAAFVHGNIKLPSQIDLQLRKILVTPDLHRIHHSATERETNSNFGGLTPWWDRLFGTYIDQPKLGHDNMIVGLSEFSDHKTNQLPWMLVQPLMGKASLAPEAAPQKLDR